MAQVCANRSKQVIVTMVAHALSMRHTYAGKATARSGGVQRLIEIGDQVVDVLDADRKADHVFGDTGFRKLFRR